MPRFFIGLVAGLGLAATAIAPAGAQAIPSGSYQQSCTNIRVRGDQLIARCTNTSGTYVRSSISLDSCRRGDIVNSNGQLACNRTGYGRGYGNGGYNNGRYGNGGYNNGGYNNGGYNNGRYGNGRYGYGAPAGSYQSSCTNVQMSGGILTATCTAANGANVTSSINPARCRGGDVANVNGRLACR
jgi:CVNH domain